MELGWVTAYVKEKAHVSDSQIIDYSLVINLSRLIRHNVIHNTSTKIAASCHITMCSLVQRYKSYVTSVDFYQSTWLVIPHNGDLHMYRPENLIPCKSATFWSLFDHTKQYDSCSANISYTN